ncbi:type II toxin-antitoxin system toxin DNA ADP-ribosyl transferase DarT [Mesoterricola silvestris]|uniref:DarT domain-containing protein n=1 Tax=Mesoterricola silvestris TaxID=2927979 RepID=A0AA48GUZ3_9BACT|nr:DUF4433 domain-containing protein [Mesoterricola silvestris]BDU74537.1 hypothetical protein METEAL_37110 [Mesoterricola silvestris]
MSTPPAQPKIYHITHMDNLEPMAADGWLLSDAQMIQKGGPKASIGMSKIKTRRLKLPVTCHPGIHVGEYVPFYFCPRSVMLYLLHRGNHPDITYTGGQSLIVHLEADLNAVVAWANQHDIPWAFSLSNAGANYTSFRANLAQLRDLNWPAIQGGDFSNPDLKEGKQAEFLLHGQFPWHLIERIGVTSPLLQKAVQTSLTSATHIPIIEVRSAWYF